MTRSKELFGIEKPDWYFEELSGVMSTFWSPFVSNVVDIRKQFPFYHKVTIAIFHGKVANWLWENKDCLSIGKRIFEKILEKEQWILSQHAKWKKKRDTLRAIFRELEKTNIKELNNKEFLELYTKFEQAYNLEYAIPTITNSFAFYAEEHLKKLLGKAGEEHFATLSAPSHGSFSGRAEESLLKIAIAAAEKGFNSQATKDMIRKHIHSFHWIENSYTTTKYPTEQDIIKEVTKRKDNPAKTLKNIKERYIKAEKNKQELLNKLDANEEIHDEIQLLVKYIDFFTGWQDERKCASLEALHHQYNFLAEIVRRTKYSKEEVYSTIFPEVKNLFENKIDKKMLQERWKESVMYGVNGKFSIVTGKKAQEIIDLVVPKVDKNIKEVQGTVASQGTKNQKTVQAKPSIIISIDEADKFNDGDILVTSMTRPDIVPLMKRAAAIVTDEGGITCHAAIISRELGIPCIIGTKIACQVLKNKKKIELDLKKGIVRIVE